MWKSPLTRFAMPGRKLLLRSILPCSSRPSATSLLELTMSTMYVGLTSRLRALVAHHSDFFFQTIRSWLCVRYSYGPVPIGFSLAIVVMSFSDRVDQMCLGTIGFS